MTPMLRATVLMLMLILAAGTAIAQGPKPGPMPPPDRLIAAFFQLTEAQQATLRKLLEERVAAVKPLAEQLGSMEQAWKELFSTPNPDAGAAGALAVQMHSIRQRIAAVHKESASSFESILTADQKGRLQFLRQASHVQPMVDAMRKLQLF